MTIKSIQKLSGRKLNEAVARKCFGFYRMDCNGPGWSKRPQDTMEVLEWLNNREDVVQTCSGKNWRNFGKNLVVVRHQQFTGATFAIAICRAAVWSAQNPKDTL